MVTRTLPVAKVLWRNKERRINVLITTLVEDGFKRVMGSNYVIYTYTYRKQTDVCINGAIEWYSLFIHINSCDCYFHK
jgi:predicted mannosyl-3-phosphoglycerate phosphatase (HAD superfamily)